MVQGAQAGTEETPEKRCKASNHSLKEVTEVDALSAFGHHERLQAGNSAFMVGREDWRDHIHEIAPCSCCGGWSIDDGKDMLECDKCLGAVHLGCNMPPLTKLPEVLLLCTHNGAGEPV